MMKEGRGRKFQLKARETMNSKILITGLLCAVLTACGGGGGGSNTSSANPEPVDPTHDNPIPSNPTSDDSAPFDPQAAGFQPSRVLQNSDGLPMWKPTTKTEPLNGGVVASNQFVVLRGSGVSYTDLMSVVNANGWQLLGSNSLAYQIGTGADSTADAIQKAKAAGIKAIPNRKMSLMSSGISNDSIYSTANNDWNLTAIHAKEAWDALAQAGGGTGDPVIGVIDGGFRFDHEDLTSFAAIMVDAAEYPNDTFNHNKKFPYCDTGDGTSGPIEKSECAFASHGMNVASIVAAKSNNSKGMAGVAPGARLYGYKFIADEIQTLQAIKWVKDVSVEVKAINMSIGDNYNVRIEKVCNIWHITGYECVSKIVDDFDEAAQTARFKNDYPSIIEWFRQTYPTIPDVLFIQSSGNNGDSTPPVPSDYNGLFSSMVSRLFAYDYYLPEYIQEIRDHTIIVGAYEMDSNGVKKISSFTSRPSPKNSNIYAPDIFILAPGGGSGKGNGEYIKNGASVNGNVAGAAFSATDRYIAMSGTSQAAPHVTGVAALMFKANPNLTAAEVKKIIFETADTVDGYKALNAEKAVKAALAKLHPTTDALEINFDSASLASLGAVNSGGVTFITGMGGRPAAKFGGINNPGHIMIPNRPAMQFTDGATFDLYARIDSMTGMTGWSSIVSDGNFAMTLIAKSHDTNGISILSSSLTGGSVTDSVWISSFSMVPNGNVCNKVSYNPVPLGQWARVTFTISKNSGIQAYLDKKLVWQCSTIVPDFSLMNTQDLYIGKFSDYWYPLDGAVQDIRIYKKALTAAEVQALP